MEWAPRCGRRLRGPTGIALNVPTGIAPDAKAVEAHTMEVGPTAAVSAGGAGQTMAVTAGKVGATAATMHVAAAARLISKDVGSLGGV